MVSFCVQAVLTFVFASWLIVFLTLNFVSHKLRAYFLGLVGHTELWRFAQRLLIPFWRAKIDVHLVHVKMHFPPPQKAHFFPVSSYTYGWVRNYVDFLMFVEKVSQTSAVSCLTQRPNDLCWFGDKPTRCRGVLFVEVPVANYQKSAGSLRNKDGITCCFATQSCPRVAGRGQGMWCIPDLWCCYPEKWYCIPANQCLGETHENNMFSSGLHDEDRMLVQGLKVEVEV